MSRPPRSKQRARQEGGRFTRAAPAARAFSPSVRSSTSQGPEDGRGGSEPGNDDGTAADDETESQLEENAAGDDDMDDGDWRSNCKQETTNQRQLPFAQQSSAREVPPHKHSPTAEVGGMHHTSRLKRARHKLETSSWLGLSPLYCIGGVSSFLSSKSLRRKRSQSTRPTSLTIL